MDFILLSLYSVISLIAAFLLCSLKKGKTTYTLALFFLSIGAWQLSISVLYGGEMLSAETIERLFRLFRIGSVSFVPILFYLTFDLLYHEDSLLSEKKKKMLKKLINKTTLSLFIGWSIFVYAAGWTKWGIQGLQQYSNGFFAGSHYYPVSGPLGWTFSVHILLLFAFNAIALYVAWHIRNKHLKSFLKVFLLSLVAGYFFGVINLSPQSPLFQGVFTLLILVMSILVGYLKMNHKIIEESNAQLIHQRTFLKKVIDLNPHFIYSKDAAGNYTMVNEALARLYATDPEEMIGKNETSYYKQTEQAIKIVTTDIALLKQQEQQLQVEEKLYDRAGNDYTVLMTKQPVFFSENQVELLCVANNITELKKNEEYMRKTEKLNIVGQLAAGVAHEIRNPLTSLKGFLQLIEQEYDINPQYMDIMLTELDRINFVAGELLVVAKPEALNKENVLLKRLIHDVVSLLSTHALLNGVSIHIEEIQEEMALTGNVNQLKQVFINLLKNGIEASSDGGTITIQAEQLDTNDIDIRITDEGCGMSEERIQKLGEPFYTGKEKGTGLGLMVSMRIIKEYDGTIEFLSEIGKGTTVLIRFPVTE